MQNLREMEAHPGNLVLEDSRQPTDGTVPGIYLHVFDRFSPPGTKHPWFYTRDSASIHPGPAFMSGLDKLSKLIKFPRQVADIGMGNYGLRANRFWVGKTNVAIGLRDLGPEFLEYSLLFDYHAQQGRFFGLSIPEGERQVYPHYSLPLSNRRETK